MWRDRTNLYVSTLHSIYPLLRLPTIRYISYRQSYAHHPPKTSGYGRPSSNGFSDSRALPEERRGLMSTGASDNDGDAVIEMDQLPPRWLDVQDEVTDLLDGITKKTATLEPLHAKHVLPGFEDEAFKKREEREIERLTQDITRSFQSCQKAIRRIEAMVKDTKRQGNISRGEETMAKNLQIALATRVGEASTAFRKKQSVYLKSRFNALVPHSSTL